MIAGRDLRAGGTWLGVSRAGRFAAVTNLRGFEPRGMDAPSRGTLVVDLLAGPDPGGTLAAADMMRYNACYAVLATPSSALLAINRPRTAVKPLVPGVHAMSNGQLDHPWCKTLRLGGILSGWLENGSAGTEQLLAGLRNPDPPSGSADDPAEIFIEDPVYGTRCSTVVLVDRDGAGLIVERRYDSRGAASQDSVEAFV